MFRGALRTHIEGAVWAEGGATTGRPLGRHGDFSDHERDTPNTKSRICEHEEHMEELLWVSLRLLNIRCITATPSEHMRSPPSPPWGERL